jgi:hypothetical protein
MAGEEERGALAHAEENMHKRAAAGYLNDKLIAAELDRLRVVAAEWGANREKALQYLDDGSCLARGPHGDCSEDHPDDGAEWCRTCNARAQLGGKMRVPRPEQGLPRIDEEVVREGKTGFAMVQSRVVEHRHSPESFRCEGDERWFTPASEWRGPFEKPRPASLIWRRVLRPAGRPTSTPDP